MIFEMTHLDIKDGKKRQCASCPVALCMKRVLGARLSCVSTMNVGVYGVVAELDRKFYHLPPHVTDFIHNFDAGKSVEPITFELAID